MEKYQKLVKALINKEFIGFSMKNKKWLNRITNALLYH
jgi:hypothetical protein